MACHTARLRVLLVTDFYLPYTGGVEHHVRTLAQGLARRGHEVGVVTTRTERAPALIEADGPVRVHRIAGWSHRLGRYSNASRPWAPPLPDPGLVVGLRRIMALERPDVVHGHDWLGRSAAPLCRLRHVPFVSSLHYYTRSCAKKTLIRDGQPCPGPAFAACIRCAARHYGPVQGVATAVGNWIGARIEDAASAAVLPVSRATAVGNRLDPPWEVVPNPLPEDDDPHAELPEAVPPGDFILYLGDLRPEKGVPVLLDAYAGLTDPPPLVLVGEAFADAPGSMPPGALAVGPVPHNAVPSLWRRATIGVVPSVWQEPFGIVVLEAMAAGCPVVASRVGGIPEIVEDGVSGVLVPPGDVGALRSAMAELLSDEPRRAALAVAGIERAGAFGTDIVLDAVEAVYRRVIAA